MSQPIRRTLRRLLGRPADVESETDEELRFHLDQRVRHLVARGRSRAEAEAEALARFGPYDESRELLILAAREREGRLTMSDRFDAVLHDLTYSLRQLQRTPGFTVAIVATFALGIGANVTMFGVVDQLFFRPPPHVRDPGQVVAIVAGQVSRGEFSQRTSNYPVYKAIRDHARGFVDVAATADIAVPLGRGQDAESLQGLLVSASYFPMLGVSPAVGRFFGPDEDIEPIGAPVVVISHALWQRRFAGERSVIGTRLSLGDRTFTVIGVAPKGFRGVELAAPDLWMPISSAGPMNFFGRGWATNSQGTWLRVYARVRDGLAFDAAAADAMRVAREAVPGVFFTGKAWAFAAMPIMRTRATEQGASASVATLLAAMSLVVLLIACANVANLLLARGMRRGREIAVRLALGIGRARLVAQLLTESLLLAVLGGASALWVAYWGNGVTRRLLFDDVAIEASPIDARMLAFTFVVAIVVGCLTGLVPALQTTRPDLVSALKAGTRSAGTPRQRTRAALLAVQAALCLLLLVGAGLFARSVANLGAMPLGVDVDRVLYGSMNLGAVGRTRGEADAIFARALERVQAVPGVASAAVAATMPFGPSFGSGVVIPGPDSARNGSALYNIVTPDYFRTLGARVLRGRDFAVSDAEGASRVMVINEMLATRYWGAASPVGQCLRAHDDSLPCATVIGVVENIRRQSIFEDSTGFIYFPLAQARHFISSRRLIVRPARGDPARLIDPVRRAMQTAAPQLPFADVHIAKDEPIVRQELRPFRLGVSMFGMFGALALVLATVGVYGVVSFDVGQRTREMGIRMALGARGGDVVGLVVRNGMRTVAFGLVAGVAIALAGARFIGPLLYETSSRDPAVLTGVSVVLLLVTAAACLLPAWRATRVDPVVALRTEA